MSLWFSGLFAVSADNSCWVVRWGVEVDLLLTAMPTPLPKTMGVRIDAAGLAKILSGKVNVER